MDMTPEQIYDIALNVVTVVDKDKSGEVDYDEFYEFFSSAEEIFLTDEQIKDLFREFDDSGDGIISL